MGRRRGNSAFPIARVKKIMQADEEVGKIATSTPVLVAKALECLMEDVLKAAAMVAAGRNSKTVQPAHLKQCIADDDQFDFLRPIVASVPSLDDPSNQPVKRKRPRPSSSASTPVLSGGASVSRKRSRSRSQEFTTPKLALPTAADAKTSSAAATPVSTQQVISSSTSLTPLVSPPPPPSKQMQDDDDDYDEDGDEEEEVDEVKVQVQVQVEAPRGERGESPSAGASGTAERVSVQALLS